GAAALFDQRGVADELDRVAQRLLGVQQDRPPAQGGAVPGGLAEGAGRHPPDLPAPLVLRPAAREVPLLKPPQRAAVAGAGVLRRQPQGLRVVRQRLPDLALRAEVDRTAEAD